MRLIDADALPKLLDAEHKQTVKLIRKGEKHLDNLAEGFAEAIRIAKYIAPTVDAVPVVRCRDCKYWGDEAGVTVRADGVRFARCKVHNLCVSGKKIGWCPTEDDFCSQGERGESNADR